MYLEYRIHLIAIGAVLHYLYLLHAFVRLRNECVCGGGGGGGKIEEGIHYRWTHNSYSFMSMIFEPNRCIVIPKCCQPPTAGAIAGIQTLDSFPHPTLCINDELYANIRLGRRQKMQCFQCERGTVLPRLYGKVSPRLYGK